ncbi:MAG TPA: lysophospholipid acyltransferase family protein [Alphaproteobacteria bacterium]
MGSSIPRAIARLCAYFLVTLPLMPVQAVLLGVGAPLARRLPYRYHRLICRVLGIEVEIHGAISVKRPTLFVCNHVSYLDIEVIGATIEASFVAKREVAGWPIFGWLAKLQRTIFVDRRSSGVANERDDLARRLEEGDNVVLFAEGTSSDGNRLKPFKSSLFSVAERMVQDRPLTVQPVSVAYTRLDGMPIGRQWRPFFAWYGAMDLAPHLWTLLGLGRLTVTMIFHPTLTMADAGSRKALAAACQAVIGRGLEAANSGRLGEPSPSSGAAAASAE